MTQIYFDSRWRGPYGMSRYSHELRRRIDADVAKDLFAAGHPLSPRGITAWERVAFLALQRARDAVLLSPAFAPAAGHRHRQIITVHDLIHLDMPGEASRLKRLFYETFVLPAVRRSPVTFTVSEYSRLRLLEWSGISEDRVVVTGNAPATHFRAVGPCHDPGFRYILYVGNTKPHKNIPCLVTSLARLDNVHLLLTGNPDPATMRRAARLGVGERVHFVGIVDDQDLPSLYRGASLFAMPSLHEGFGIPVVEAMACGTPVVASNRSALPEVIGGAGLLVDPGDDWAEAISWVLSDPALHDQLAESGVRRAADFTWAAVADRVRVALRAAFD